MCSVLYIIHASMLFLQVIRPNKHNSQCLMVVPLVLIHSGALSGPTQRESLPVWNSVQESLTQLLVGPSKASLSDIFSKEMVISGSTGWFFKSQPIGNKLMSKPLQCFYVSLPYMMATSRVSAMVSCGWVRIQLNCLFQWKRVCCACITNHLLNSGQATRYCNENGEWSDPDVLDCQEMEFVAISFQVWYLISGKLCRIQNTGHNLTIHLVKLQ